LGVFLQLSPGNPQRLLHPLRSRSPPHAASASSVQGLGFGIEGLGFRVEVWGCRVQGAGIRVYGSGFRVQGSGFKVQGSGFRVQGAGFRVSGLAPRAGGEGEQGGRRLQKREAKVRARVQSAPLLRSNKGVRVHLLILYYY
jgi:hypothetical protein